MANGKKKWVAFKGNLTIPAAMAGDEKDQKVQSGEPVQVPAFYADSVVQDGIAAHCDAPKKKPASKKADEPTDAEKAAAKSAKFELAKDAVVDAQAALDAAEGTDAASDARATLLAAQQALAALQG